MIDNQPLGPNRGRKWNVPAMNSRMTSALLEQRTGSNRVSCYDWNRIASDLSSNGAAVPEKLLPAKECQQIAALYPEEQHFRNHIVMARHGFGKGEYQYFKYPLPDLIGDLRTTLYLRLAPIANQWNERMEDATRYPAEHAEFLERCHERGQLRPTPLLLQYVPGDYNCLHQDLYGDLAFPLHHSTLPRRVARTALDTCAQIDKNSGTKG
jgi:hypothetical protein